MNELIKELAVEAGGEHLKGAYPGAVFFYPGQLEKFAELIVQECANACVHTGVLEQNEATGKMYADSVKEHFGVK